jgi:hypothetical protein
MKEKMFESGIVKIGFSDQSTLIAALSLQFRNFRRFSHW